MGIVKLNIISLYVRAFAVSILAVLCQRVSAGAPDTHCKAEEHVFANAKMHRIETRLSSDIPLTDKSEKILSLCGDIDKEPLNKLVYRFGPIGKVEMEMVATRSNKAGLSTLSDGASHTGSISIHFNNGPYAYVVSEGMGMTYGIRILVYKSRKYLFGFQSDEYDSRMIFINFDKVNSPIFKLVKTIGPQ